MREAYPTSLIQFQAQFGTEVACAALLERLKWPLGYRCPKCDHPTRIGHTTLEDGHRVRVCGHCGQALEVTT